MITKKRLILVLIILLVIFYAFAFEDTFLNGKGNNQESNIIELNEINAQNEITKLLFNRKSIRNYSQKPLELSDISKIIWAAEGINVDGISGPTRTSPSAGATNPLVIYLSVSNVNDLKPGLYRYDPIEHSIEQIIEKDISNSLAKAALNQSPVSNAPAVLVITADYNKTTDRYDKRGIKYVHMESGAAAENAILTAQSLGIDSVVIGAFYDKEIKKVMGEISEEPQLLIPLGIK